MADADALLEESWKKCLTSVNRYVLQKGSNVTELKEHLDEIKANLENHERELHHAVQAHMVKKAREEAKTKERNHVATTERDHRIEGILRDWMVKQFPVSEAQTMRICKLFSNRYKPLCNFYCKFEYVTENNNNKFVGGTWATLVLQNQDRPHYLVHKYVLPDERECVVTQYNSLSSLVTHEATSAYNPKLGNKRLMNPFARLLEAFSAELRDRNMDLPPDRATISSTMFDLIAARCKYDGNKCLHRFPGCCCAASDVSIHNFPTLLFRLWEVYENGTDVRAVEALRAATTGKAHQYYVIEEF